MNDGQLTLLSGTWETGDIHKRFAMNPVIRKICSHVLLNKLDCKTTTANWLLIGDKHVICNPNYHWHGGIFGTKLCKNIGVEDVDHPIPKEGCDLF